MREHHCQSGSWLEMGIQYLHGPELRYKFKSNCYIPFTYRRDNFCITSMFFHAFGSIATSPRHDANGIQTIYPSTVSIWSLQLDYFLCRTNRIALLALPEDELCRLKCSLESGLCDDLGIFVPARSYELLYFFMITPLFFPYWQIHKA